LVSSASTQDDACEIAPYFNVYAQDLGNCGGCAPLTCWACLTTSQQVYLDAGLTIPVPTAYYSNQMAPGNYATWLIVGGFPQPAGFNGCSSTPDSDATTYLNSIVSAGGSLTPTISAATYSLFAELKDTGIWSKLYVFYPTLGGTSASTAINAKNPGTFTMTWNGGITFSSTGVQGNGVNGYGNTGWDEVSDGASINDFGYGLYSRSDISQNGTQQFDMGAEDADYRTQMNIRNSGNMVGTIQDDLVGLTYSYSNSPSSGFNVLQRTDSTSVKGYNSGTILGTETIVSYGRPTRDVFVMCKNSNGSPNTRTSREYNWFQTHQALTGGEVSTLNTIITNFNTALGRL
jgi:hypothetical protein